jgi:acyl carrier protein
MLRRSRRWAMRADAVDDLVREFVIETFVFTEADRAGLTETTDLVELGILDSMNVLQLVDYIEEQFDIMLDPEDLFLLTTLDGIVAIIRDKAEP